MSSSFPPSWSPSLCVHVRCMGSFVCTVCMYSSLTDINIWEIMSFSVVSNFEVADISFWSLLYVEGLSSKDQVLWGWWLLVSFEKIQAEELGFWISYLVFHFNLSFLAQWLTECKFYRWAFAEVVSQLLEPFVSCIHLVKKEIVNLAISSKFIRFSIGDSNGVFCFTTYIVHSIICYKHFFMSVNLFH